MITQLLRRCLELAFSGEGQFFYGTLVSLLVYGVLGSREP